jgi:hypothetical protein
VSALDGTRASSTTEGIEGVDAIMRHGGETLRERMARVELHL